jgi:hypothetical protein
MDESEELFSNIFVRLTTGYSRLHTFRQMVLLGEDSAKESMKRLYQGFVEEQLVGGSYQRILKDPDSFVEKGYSTALPGIMATNAAALLRRTMSSAILVFSHSILDAAIQDLLRVSYLVRPIDWNSYIQDQKVSFHAIDSIGLSKSISSATSKELERMERASLIQKIDRLFALCKPSNQSYLNYDFRFDRDRLIMLDNVRHDTVHGEGLGSEIGDIDDHLLFFNRCGMHFWCMVSEEYGLKISAERTATLFMNHDPSSPAELL